MVEGTGAIILVILILAFALVTSTWVFIDAEKNSPHDPMLWGLIVLFSGILGIILYFLLGRDNKARTSSQTTLYRR